MGSKHGRKVTVLFRSDPPHPPHGPLKNPEEVCELLEETINRVRQARFLAVFVLRCFRSLGESLQLNPAKEPNRIRRSEIEGGCLHEPISAARTGGDCGGAEGQNMTDDETDVACSQSVAGLAADALVTAGLVAKADFDRIHKIIAEEMYVRLVARDRPDRANWRYKSN
jgi:hypothetical protein